ncbi:hypothetical protein D3C78_205880 [compost metagenome]
MLSLQKYRTRFNGRDKSAQVIKIIASSKTILNQLLFLLYKAAISYLSKGRINIKIGVV